MPPMRMQKPKSVLRKRTEGKPKDGKFREIAANIQKVREFISNASASEVIQIQNLKLEALSTLSLCLSMMMMIKYEDHNNYDDGAG